jgi:hypothetical protein
LVDANMTALACIFLVFAFLVCGDLTWTAFRDWRVKRLAIKRGRTLTEKFCLPTM